MKKSIDGLVLSKAADDEFINDMVGVDGVSGKTGSNG